MIHRNYNFDLINGLEIMKDLIIYKNKNFFSDTFRYILTILEKVHPIKIGCKIECREVNIDYT